MLDTITFVVLNVLIKQFFQFSMRFQKHNKYEYHLVYKGLKFDYYMGSQTLVIKANAHKVLEKGFVSLQDLENYKNRLLSIVKEVTGTDKLLLQLSRLDYCVDLAMDTNCEEIEDTLELLYKHVHSYRHMKIDKIYDTSFYLKTKRGTYNLNCYDKYEELSRTDEDYKGIFRLELQIKKYKMKRELKRNGVSRELDNYWTKSAMEEYFFDFLKGFFYSCDYYRIDIAISKIKESLYSQSMQDKLIRFIKKVNKIGMTEVKKCYSYSTAKSYIEKLEKIGLNPVTISEDKTYEKVENLLHRAKRVTEELYF